MIELNTEGAKDFALYSLMIILLISAVKFDSWFYFLLWVLLGVLLSFKFKRKGEGK